MKLWIVLYVDDDGKRCLDSVWDSAAVAADPELVWRQTEAAGDQPGVASSHWILADLPDSVVLPYLQPVPARLTVDEVHRG